MILLLAGLCGFGQTRSFADQFVVYLIKQAVIAPYRVEIAPNR
jgi:hypothetical protein